MQGVTKTLVVDKPIVGELTVRNSKKQYQIVYNNITSSRIWQNLAKFSR